MLYLDTSAIVKRYVREPGTEDVASFVASVGVVATATIARAESAAAFAKAARIGSLTAEAARACHKALLREWKDYVRVRITEALVARADNLAWLHRLRGYDAIHLAAALEWQDRLGDVVTLCTFDRELWNASAEAGLDRRPASLEGSRGRRPS
ncbi:MAG: type II toxin-antitoxin system VapC family toxin [Vicinamibacterales bacterium]